MGFMQALKADWKKLTTKEGWKQRFAEDEAKRQAKKEKKSAVK